MTKILVTVYFSSPGLEHKDELLIKSESTDLADMKIAVKKCYPENYFEYTSIEKIDIKKVMG